MFSAKFNTYVKIAGCPESGLAALDYSREHGLVERGDNRVPIALDGPISEEIFRKLEKAGYTISQFESGSLQVYGALRNLEDSDFQPESHFGWRATVDVTPNSAASDLLVAAAAVAYAAAARSVEATKQRDLERAQKDAADKARWAEEARVAAEKEQAQRSKLRDFLGSHASSNVLERFDAGVLPESELEAVLETVLFEPFSRLEPFAPIEECDVIAECGCEPDEVKFNSVASNDDLTAEQWEALKRVREIAGKVAGSKVQVRDHVGYQDGRTAADDPEVRKLGIRVTIEFAGETVSREFAADCHTAEEDLTCLREGSFRVSNNSDR